MPLYQYECQVCLLVFERQLPLVQCDEQQDCPVCQEVAKKILTHLTTCCKDKDRRWGQSLYRRHDRGEKVKTPKMPGFIPGKRKGEGG
jgi:putative FmdB family regulatory protein